METQKLTGTIIFLKANEGSKSEAVVPFLYQGKAVPPQRILMKDDNPFENNGFVAFDGKVVELMGFTAPNGTFVVESIITAS